MIRDYKELVKKNEKRKEIPYRKKKGMKWCIEAFFLE